jgi:protein-disulfide isomerase
MEFAMKSLVALFMLTFSIEHLIGTNEQSEKTTTTEVKEESFQEKLKKMVIPDDLKLQEVIIGNENAPNTVIIYSSFTCSHCGIFHKNEFSKFKEKYVDTGKAKVYQRNYVDDPGALEAATLVRYFGGSSNEKVVELIHKVFAKQKEWLESKDPRKFLIDMFVEFGYDRKEVEAHVADTKVSAGLMKEQQRAMNELKVSLIPSFIVNGKLHQGKLDSEEIAKMF